MCSLRGSLSFCRGTLGLGMRHRGLTSSRDFGLMCLASNIAPRLLRLA